MGLGKREVSMLVSREKKWRKAGVRGLFVFRGKRGRVKGEVGVFTKGLRQLMDGQVKY